MAVTMPATGASTPRAERPLMLDACLVDSGPPGQRRRRVTLPVSIALHTAAAFALIAVPLLVSDAMPEVQTGVRAFLVEPLSVAPPPPPPAARPAVAPRVAPKPVQQQAFIAPVEVPQEIVPEQALDLGSADQGVSGGVEGGIPGGVVGGIVGGLPDAPAPVAPVRVGGSVREPRRLTAVPPVYPELALKARLQGTVIIEATVNERGRVVDATLLQGLPMLTEAALEAVKKWTYTPTLVNGVPTPIIMTVTVHFRLS